ncbi:MAG: hypothetical protein IPL12_00065 [Bacteroidetes bacterium]|nr:hypothetical protein [Bacteroidota bacterium]MBK8341824.1 hypothetical protein [Bacteroidota bacterium]
MNRNLSKMYALLLVLLAIAYASCDEFPFDGLGGADPDLTDTIYDPGDSIWIDEGDTTDIGWPDDSTDIDWPGDTIGWPEDSIIWPGDSIYEDSIP